MIDRFLSLFKPSTIETRTGISGVSETRNSLEIKDGPLATVPSFRDFRFTGYNRSEFYRFLRDNIPIVSAGIWTWVRLCTTKQRLEFDGNEAVIRRAQDVAANLQRRIYPRVDGDANGLERLTESLFLDLFTLGRFALRVQLFPDASGISHIEALDPNRIRWHRDGKGIMQACLEDEEGNLESIPPETFFHRNLISDIHMPDGIEPLASIPFVVEIEQKMLEDMARSSHNAGTPRLQVQLTPPERLPGEDYETYTQRINQYFDSTVGQFKDLAADDNLFTWSDVTVRLVGGSGDSGKIWKLNREQVIEDVITGLKLFPWALGRSHGTTKNWIFAQYNLLMQIVDSVQRIGSDLAEWLLRLELNLQGYPVKPIWIFAPNQDPFIVERNQAKLMEVERIERLLEAGIISRDQAARELGYSVAFQQEK